MSMEENTDVSVKSNEGQEEKPNSESLLPKPTTGSMQELPGKFSAAGVANWAKNLRISSNPNVNTLEKNSVSSEGLKNPFSLLGGSFGRKTESLKIPVVEVPIDSESSSSNEGTLGNLAKGILDTSKSAMKAVQTKARHLVSQNKRRYQEDGFDLDLAYITDNIIAMGFPAGDMSSGILGFVEGFYRNHMEEVIKFLETHHKEKYKVYNLCSERLYDASLFEGKVACFPFDDHNCPPLQLVTAFCQSAYSWLKADLENVVVVHCKAGKARTGLMITALLLFLKFFPTAEESIAFYNQKRCVDGKGLILPSQIRYVKYFERVLRNCDGVTPVGRKVVLRGFRLHKCPYWIRPSITILNHDRTVFSSKKHPRTKDMMPEDIWFNAPRKGIMVFALPGERGLADLDGDFKVLFHDRHGDFYCWLNTNMMENRTMLTPADLDGFDKRRLPSPGFQVEIVILDYDVSISSKVTENAPGNPLPSTIKENPPTTSSTEGGNKKGNQDKDDVFSDTESEGSVRKPKVSPNEVPDLQMEKEVKASTSISNQKVRDPQSNGKDNNLSSSKEVPQQVNNGSSIESSSTEPSKLVDHGSKADALQLPASDFKAIAAASAADASVFTFGDEEDFDSEDDS